jgi:predicted amidohydrolase
VSKAFAMAPSDTPAARRPEGVGQTLGAIRIAAAQYPIGQPATFEAWAENIAKWVAEGARTGAQLLLFPEYGAIELAATCGPAVHGDLQATLGAVADLVPRMEATFVGLARKHDVLILAGSGPSRRADGRFTNTARLITPDGRIGSQDKLIMTPFEVAWGVVPGDVCRVFDTALGRIGIAVCYDCEFPLLVRAQAEAGAEVILIPSCTERLAGYHRVRAGAVARALESQIATVTSPTIGDAPWSAAVDRNTGAAGIFTPPEAQIAETGILAEGRINEPGWIAGTIDLAALRRIRHEGEMRNHADWDRQPGVMSLVGRCQVVALL